MNMNLTTNQKNSLSKMETIDLSGKTKVDNYFQNADLELVRLWLLYWSKRDKKIYQYKFKNYDKISMNPFIEVQELMNSGEGYFEKPLNPHNSQEKTKTSLTRRIEILDRQHKQIGEKSIKELIELEL